MIRDMVAYDIQCLRELGVVFGDVDDECPVTVRAPEGEECDHLVWSVVVESERCGFAPLDARNGQFPITYFVVEGMGLPVRPRG